MVIYCIENIVTKKMYVGQTRNEPKWRFHRHMTCKRSPFISDIKNYGKESFTLKVLDVCKSPEDMDRLEIEWIKKLNTIQPSGYNRTRGGCAFAVNQPKSETCKKRISAAHKGKKKSQKCLEILAAYNEARKISKEEKEKRERIKLENIAKCKMGEALLLPNELRKKKIIRERDNKIFESVRECFISIGANRVNLQKHLNGKYPKTIFGEVYKWA